MHWIIQENIFREKRYDILVECLEKHSIPYNIVKTIPFTDSIEPEIEVSDNVIVCGSTKLTDIAVSRGWISGVFINDNMRFEVWKENYGKEMLNWDSAVMSISDFNPEEISFDEFFIRPCEDNKMFAGAVVEKHNYDKWFNQMLLDNPKVTTETQVAVAELKKIYSETRFFVVDGKVITGSHYRIGGYPQQKQCIDDEIISYAQKMVDLWSPARAFVIDIAKTDLGLKVIEFNNFNSSGYYDCNIPLIVEAVESMDKDKSLL